jgi:protease-4
LASEEIWREVSLANEVKTVIVSMGDVAASGGYYISAPAKRIFAEPTTITGSIGVFGVIPYTGKMLEEKLGLTFDRASTNTHSVMTTNRKLTDKEFDIIQSEVNKIYSEFVDVVAKGRDLTPDRVNQIARGRVWTGVDALEIGLVDEMGGLNDAIQYAIKDAKIEKPVYVYYPKSKKDGFMEILEMIAEQQQEDDQATTKETLSGEVLKLMKQIKDLDNMTGVQMRMP